MKKLVLVFSVMTLVVSAVFANGGASGSAEKPYIAVVSKGEQHDFWQQVRRGAMDAAADFNVDVTFEGPPTESDVQIQVEMINNAISKAPAALALAALDTTSVIDQLSDLRDKGIPVIGFDSGVPNAPEGSILANASTNNYAAAGLAAEKMFEIIKPEIEAATDSSPVKIVVLNQDASGESLLSRGTGFRDTMIKLIDEQSKLSRSDISVIGNPAYVADDSPKTGGKVFIEMIVPASAANTDAAASASAMLNKVEDDSILGVFCSNESTAKGILAATNDGADLANKYNIVVIGFDAGAGQKNAVRKELFAGSITQDPYSIGYKAVELANKSIKGEMVEDVDTGAKYYTSANMDDPDIAPLLYD
ncbi:periplasmic binding protein/LacI transcriptional regulator [Olavius algarvensis spirochete endosymbiont]|uniref:substrate-binding domain-containing protein n=1 Tax=Olavius algarvensis spirochete endosymbiont TaxID=260710 RepID=UPI000F198E8B|nr:substrate-binding domain-containing protein [Olavius algarvensis spirochete endosymbiont]VDB00680.1 periplasmic binding protein/LacI transcriptional regulator [Olavius algarvensis spirochete endosymbiont]